MMKIPNSYMKFLMDPANHLTLEEEDEIYVLLLQKKRSPEILDRLTKGHYWLVIYLAGKYQGLGIDYDDLIQTGVCELLEAAQVYDPCKGERFMDFACTAMRKAIMRSFDTLSRPVTLSFREAREERKSGERNISRQSESGEIYALMGDDPRPLLEYRDTVRAIRETLFKADPELEALMTAFWGLDGEPPLTTKAVAERFGMRYAQVKWKAVRARRILEREGILNAD